MNLLTKNVSPGLSQNPNMGEILNKFLTGCLIIGILVCKNGWVLAGNGCSGVPTPHSAMVQRKGDTLTIHCEDSGKKWQLICKDELWVGDYGNCGIDWPIECPNIPAPEGAWLQRTGKVVWIECDTSQEVWGYGCSDGKWMGDHEYKECGTG